MKKVVIKLLSNYLKNYFDQCPSLYDYSVNLLSYDKDKELSTIEIYPNNISQVKYSDILRTSYYWPIFFAGVFKGKYITNDIKNKFFGKYLNPKDGKFSDKPIKDGLECIYTNTSNKIYSNFLTNFIGTSNLINKFSEAKIIPIVFLNYNTLYYRNLKQKFSITRGDKRPKKLIYSSGKSNKYFPIFDMYFKFIKKCWLNIEGIIRVRIMDNRMMMIYSDDDNIKIMLDFLIEFFTEIFEDIYNQSYLKKFNYLDD